MLVLILCWKIGDQLWGQSKTKAKGIIADSLFPHSAGQENARESSDNKQIPIRYNSIGSVLLRLLFGSYFYNNKHIL